MKKLFLILVCLPILVFADDCANAYKAGLDLYKHGQYVEAQAKFIAVAKICGDYADIWNKLKSCNQKLSEKQSQQASQIKSLKAEITQKEQMTGKSSTSTLGLEALKNIDSINVQAQQSKAQLKVAKDSIATLNSMLNETNAVIEKLRKEVESLNQQIDELMKTASAKENTKKEGNKKGTGKKAKE